MESDGQKDTTEGHSWFWGSTSWYLDRANLQLSILCINASIKVISMTLDPHANQYSDAFGHVPQAKR